MEKIGKSILDKDILTIEQVDGELTAHIDGYVYEGEDGLKLVQFTGVYIPLDVLKGLDVEGISGLIDDMEMVSTQYVDDLGDADIDEFVSEVYGEDIAPITLSELASADEGVYYLI